MILPAFRALDFDICLGEDGVGSSSFPQPLFFSAHREFLAKKSGAFSHNDNRTTTLVQVF